MKPTKYGRCGDSTLAINQHGRCGVCRARKIHAVWGCPLLPGSRIKRAKVGV